MAMPSPLPQALVEHIASRFKALSDPKRIEILDRLRDGERSVSELVEDVGGSQQNISKHLSTLYADGIVGRRKEGTRVLYRIVDQGVIDLCEHVCGSLERRASELRELIEAG
jgi:DNA-binding transcriptional ArsR family regulator